MAERFEDAVGPENVAEGSGQIAGAAVERVLRPGSPAEVAACLRIARERGLAVVARGGGSKLDWGNPLAVERVSVLETGRLTRVLEIEPDEGIATLGAGLGVREVSEKLAERGLCSRLDPTYARSSVGGTVAADPVGPEYGLDRRLRIDLLGLQVALSNGELTRCGGRVVKNVTGFDLVRLYCGSLGTLGIVTEATLRVHAVPEQRRVLAKSYDSAESALREAGAELAEPLRPASLALRPAPAGGAELLWLFEGRAAAVEEVARRCPGEPRDPSAWAAVADEIRRRPEEGAGLRVAARMTDSAEIVGRLAELGGPGALRVALPAAGLAFARLEEDAVERLMETAARRGWGVFVESASPSLRRRIDAFGPAPDTIELMRALKQRFDPGRVLAPGRFVAGI